MSKTRALLPLFGATVIYFALARFGMAVFALHPSNITPLWLPSGLALVMCLEWGMMAFPFIVLASFCANLEGMLGASLPLSLLHTGIAALTDGMAGVLAMRMFRVALPEGLSHSRDLLPFLAWVCLLPTLASSLILGVNLALGKYVSWADVGGLMRVLLLADSLGLLLVYPIYQGWQERARDPQGQARALLLAGLGIGALLAASLNGLPGMEFFIVPVLLMLSLYVGLLGLTSVGALTLIVIVAGAARHLGPFADGDLPSGHFRLAAFAFSCALTTLGMALQRGQLAQTEQTRQLWQDAAEHDALTGLLNRRVFLPRVQQEHQRSLRSKKPYAVAMLDLDHFKNVNNSHGHAGGDRVLSAFAAVVQENCRIIDTVARVGGEEFAVLLPECSAEQAEPILERIRSRLADLTVPIDGQGVTVTVSIGVAVGGSGPEAASEVLARADKALYRAKLAGRNRIVIDSPPPRTVHLA